MINDHLGLQFRGSIPLSSNNLVVDKKKKTCYNVSKKKLNGGSKMDFAGMTVDEIKAVIAEGREVLKARTVETAEADKVSRTADKTAADAAGRVEVEGLVEGDGVLVTFKGKDTVATFVRMTDKRFTVEVEGEKRSIMFDKFITSFPTGEDAVEADAETVEADAEAV